MSAAAVFGLISLLSSLAQGGAAVGKGVKKKKHREKQNAYAKQMERIEEEERKRAEREARRNAMSRAIKDPTVYGPRKSPNLPKRPGDLDTSGLDITQGVAGMTGQLASQAGQDFGEGGKYGELFDKLKARRRGQQNVTPRSALGSDVGFA